MCEITKNGGQRNGVRWIFTKIDPPDSQGRCVRLYVNRFGGGGGQYSGVDKKECLRSFWYTDSTLFDLCGFSEKAIRK